MELKISGVALFELYQQAIAAQNWNLKAQIDELVRQKAPAIYRVFFDGIYGAGYGCSNCPFARNPEDVNIADPDEGFYDCALKSEPKVWGESPVCTEADWQRQAQKELFELLGDRIN